MFQDNTNVTLSSSSQAAPQKWLQLALLRDRTSGSSKHHWSLFTFKYIGTKTRDIFLNVEVEVWHHLQIFLLSEKSQEQILVLFLGYRGRSAHLAFVLVSRVYFRGIIPSFLQLFFWDSKSAYSKEMEVWFFWQFFCLAQSTHCC